MRRDSPGNLVTSGGDIDNRLKTLLDALRVPDVIKGMPDMPSEDEDPFFCLLEDDCLITALSVTTDTLLVPQADEERQHDVVLVIHVITQTRSLSETGTGWMWISDRLVEKRNDEADRTPRRPDERRKQTALNPTDTVQKQNFPPGKVTNRPLLRKAINFPLWLQYLLRE
jgi:hypothetical protein